jgi:hypothetical protein
MAPMCDMCLAHLNLDVLCLCYLAVCFSVCFYNFIRKLIQMVSLHPCVCSCTELYTNVARHHLNFVHPSVYTTNEMVLRILRRGDTGNV